MNLLAQAALILLIVLGVYIRLVSAQGRDETLVFALPSDIETYDMHNHALRAGIIVGHNVFDNLVARDLKTLQIVPHLAISWRTPDDLTWEFKLRGDVRFHNGDKFTAHTVKFNFDRVLNPENKFPQRSNHALISDVEVVDDYTVRFRTSKPYPLMLERLTQLQMLSEKVVREKGNEWIAENAVGTGPYKLVSWKRKQEHLWVRNDNHWGPKPAFKYVRVRIIPDVGTRVAELISGGVDIIRDVPHDQADVIDRSGQARTASAPVLTTAFIGLDSAGRSGPNPFQNRRVRQAVNYGVHSDNIIRFVLRGLADRVATAVSPLAFGFEPSIKAYPYDLEKAKKLLAEAGYPKGFEVRFRTIRSAVSHVDDAVVADLAKIGVQARQSQIGEMGPYVTQVRQGKAGPMFGWAWGYYSVFDADAILFDNFRCGEPPSYYCNKELDGLVDAGRSAVDRTRRREIYSRAQQILFDEAAALFQWAFHRVWGISNRIEYAAPVDEIDRLFTAAPRKQ